MIERNVDYLQVSCHIKENNCRDNAYTIIPPVAFYKRGYQSPEGVRYYYGNPNTKKALCIYSGQALQTLRGGNVSDAEIIASALSKGARCSRIDLAVTEYIEDTLVCVSQVEAWFTARKIISSHCDGGCKEIVSVPTDGEKAIQTLYIGDIAQRGKRGIFRAYDKGVEMNLEPFLITRLEIEDRGDKAMSTFKRIADTNDIAGNFRARFDVDDPEFERIMQSPVAETTRGQNLQKRAEIDIRNARWNWLINQVAPAIKTAIKDDELLQLGDEMLVKFLTNSGLQALMRDEAQRLAVELYFNMLQDNGLLDSDYD